MQDYINRQNKLGNVAGNVAAGAVAGTACAAITNMVSIGRINSAIKFLGEKDSFVLKDKLKFVSTDRIKNLDIYKINGKRVTIGVNKSVVPNWEIATSMLKEGKETIKQNMPKNLLKAAAIGGIGFSLIAGLAGLLEKSSKKN